MRPKSVVLTVLLASILSSTVIHLGQRLVQDDPDEVANPPLRTEAQLYAGGFEWRE